MQIIKLYSVKQFSHKIFDGFYEIGETSYNANILRKPLRKYGKAPCGLLAFYQNWQNLNDAEITLRVLGFQQKNKLEWEKK